MTPSSSTQRRVAYIDNLKGLLIILVVLGHSIQSIDPQFDSNTLFRYIYAFHMPAFMFVSGYVSYKATMEWRTIGKRARQLLVPFLCWAVVAGLLSEDGSRIVRTIVHPDSGLWFLYALFFITAINIVTVRCCDRWRIKPELGIALVGGVLVAVMLVLKFKLFGFQFVAWYFIFYNVGFFFHQYEKAFSGYEKPMGIIFLVSYLVLAHWWMRKLPPSFMLADSSAIYCYLYKLIVAVVACLGFWWCFKHWVKEEILVLNHLGKITLGIYAIHQTVLGLVEPTLSSRITLSYAPYVALLTLVALGITYLVYLLLDTNRYTAFLFLGVSPTRATPVPSGRERPCRNKKTK